MSIDVLFVFVMQCRVLTSLCRCSLRVVCCVLCVIGVLVIAVMRVVVLLLVCVVWCVAVWLSVVADAVS